MVIAHQTHKLHDTLVVKLIENIVQKQNGFVSNLLIVKLKLRQTD